jgi:sigma-B regulation protein RsbU (phosphoserine phosphatase)
VGVFPDAGFEDATVELLSGDSVIFYTDGATERRRRGGDEAAWFELIRSCSGLAADQIVARLNRVITGSGDLADDVAVLVLRLDGED